MTLEEFVVKIGFQTDKAGIDNIEKNLSNVAKKTNSAFSSVLGLVGKIGLAASAWQVGKFAVQSTAQLERMTAQFEVMLGSAQKANTMVKDIQALAASTPLTSLGITESVKTLLAFGVAGNDAIKTVRMLGDVAGGDQERLSSLALAYGQTMSATKLMGQDLLQYINVGFNPLKVMAENATQFGLKATTSMSELRDMMSKGQISAEMVTKAFQIVTSKGGMFYQNMQKQSKTLGGLWSTLIDNIQIGLVKAMEPLLPVMKEFVDYLGQIDWTPIVNYAKQFADLLVNYIVPAVKDLANNYELLISATILVFGPGFLARIAKYGSTITYTTAATVRQTAALKTQAEAEAMLMRAQQMRERAAALGPMNIGTSALLSKANLIEKQAANLSKFDALLTTTTSSFGAFRTAGVGAWTSIKTAMMGMLTPLNVLIAGLALAYYGMKKLDDMENKDAYAAYDKEVARIEGLLAPVTSRSTEVAGLLADAKAGGAYWKGSQGRKEVGKLQEEAKDLEKRKAQLQRQLAAARGVRGEAADLYGQAGVSGDKQAWDQQLQSIQNNSKKVTNNIYNDIKIDTKVDDKGQSPLSVAAVKSVADTAIRSALNIRLLGLVEGV